MLNNSAKKGVFLCVKTKRECPAEFKTGTKEVSFLR